MPGSGAVFGWVRSLPSGAVDDAERVDRLRVLEDLKSAICAEQSVLAVDLDASQRSLQEAAGLPRAQRGRGVAAQVGLARRESPNRGQVLLGLAKVLTGEMPHTLARLSDGTLSEYAVTLLAKETGCLTLADRQSVDEQLCADPDALGGWGIRRLTGEARRLTQSLDAAACVRRNARARSQRFVSLRPAADTMTYLTALLPVEQGVAAYAALCVAADTVVATGAADEVARTRGQLMADTLVERITGQVKASDVPLTVNLVVSDQTLLGNGADQADGTDPAVIGDHTIPAALARQLVHTGLDAECRTELRRLYACPDTSQLTALDARSRIFPAGLARFIDLRDRTCRTPWCDAPIRHHDHVTDHALGGPTNAENGQGLCVACNHAKQAPGWRAEAVLREPGRPIPSRS